MHPYRYDGSPGPYQALLERLATMGEARGGGREPNAGDNRPAMPGWRDPFPYMAEGQLDAHLFDLRRMAKRDQPNLHEADDLTKTLGAHVITGACSAMHSLRARQEALEIIEQRAEWLATYLTPERLDVAEQWRDRKAVRGAQAQEVGEHRTRAQTAMCNIRLAIQFSYADSRAALVAWDKLLADPGTGGVGAAASAVVADPSILGELRGGKTWFGLGGEDRDRLRARDRLADLTHHAAQFTHHDQLAQRADRKLKAIEDVPPAEGELADTLAALRDMRRIDLHYMLHLQDKVVQTRRLIAQRSTDPVGALAASHALFQELRDADNVGERLTGTDLKKAMAVTLQEVRRDPVLTRALAAKGLSPDQVFSEKAPAPPAQPEPRRAMAAPSP